MEEIVEHLGKGVLALLRVIVAVIWASVEFTLEKIIWYIGWPLVRAITLGKYPKERLPEGENASILTQFIVCSAGVGLPLFGVLLLAGYIG